MRIPIATDISTRDGTLTKDAKLVNAFVDDGNVFKRPASQGGISVGTGTAQGGIGFYIGSTPYFVGFWGDTLVNYTGSGTNWNSGTTYPQGSMVSVGFVNYWSVDDSDVNPTPNVNNDPTTTPSRWRRYPSYCRVPVIPAPVVIGTSQQGPYYSPPTIPGDSILSDVVVSYYCSGVMHKKTTAHYSITTDSSAIGYDGYPTRNYAIWMKCSTYANANWLHAEPYDNGGYTTWWKNNVPVPSFFVYPSGLPPYNDTPTPGTGTWFGPATAYEPTIGPITVYYLTETVTESYYII